MTLFNERNGTCSTQDMTHENKHDRTDAPHGHRDRGVSTDQPNKKPSKEARPGSHDPEAAGYEADKTFEPDRDGSRS